MSPNILDESCVIWFGPQHVSAHGWATKLTLVGDYSDQELFVYDFALDGLPGARTVVKGTLSMMEDITK